MELSERGSSLAFMILILIWVGPKIVNQFQSLIWSDQFGSDLQHNYDRSRSLFKYITAVTASKHIVKVDL